MTGPEYAVGEPQAEPSGRSKAPPSPTRGFLFADLRDYTHYVEAHGAADAAELLVRYRSIVREAVAEHDGAEIKTEGDSFYVVFHAVSAAVLCGLAIVEAAGGRRSGRPPAGRSRSGIGIHAGETIETPDGYVGSPVNIAARICAIAEARRGPRQRYRPGADPDRPARCRSCPAGDRRSRASATRSPSSRWPRSADAMGRRRLSVAFRRRRTARRRRRSSWRQRSWPGSSPGPSSARLPASRRASGRSGWTCR